MWEMIGQINYLNLSWAGLAFFSLLLVISSLAEIRNIKPQSQNSGNKSLPINKSSPVLYSKSKKLEARPTKGGSLSNGSLTLKKTKNSELEQLNRSAEDKGTG